MKRELLNNVLGHMQRKMAQYHCPICKQDKYIVMQELALLGNQNAFFPMVIISCQGCGFTMLFNILMAGVAKPEDLIENQTPTPGPVGIQGPIQESPVHNNQGSDNPEIPSGNCDLPGVPGDKPEM